MSSVIGRCELCGEVEAELLESHFLPKFMYARLNELKQGGTKIKIKDNENNLYNIGRQIVDHKFCEKYECKLNKGGENYFGRVGLPPRKGELAPLVLELGDRLVEANQALNGRDIQTIDSEKIFNFALGMFWRATLSWPKHKSIILPVCPDDAIRAYLSKGGDYPLGLRVDLFLDRFHERYAIGFPAMMNGFPWFPVQQIDFVLREESPSDRVTSNGPPIFYAMNQDVSRSYSTICARMYEDASARGS